ncbi:DUF1559 domain-containing protein [Roseimaritima ulvae]|uniref:DUF1559 domain-containing protein n=1 Tax=Roseimaritima ulvae TaxID=980254 RepID=A0A5B9R0L1_9BACT|nr:DUF1559 domain-containing protein [Roseimaritima ulvae]QEG43789.1 hypothetical protein UC8_58450 [Roseimaritima ulvae]
MRWKWPMAVLLGLCCLVVLSLLAMGIQAAREAARRMGCSNNLKQLGLACFNYHDTYSVLPPACGGTGPTPGYDTLSNQRRLSGFVGLIPFIEATPLFDTISGPYVTGDMPTPDPEEAAHMKGPYFRDHLDELSTAEGPLVMDNGDHYFPAMGPAPWLAADYPPWQVRQYGLRCPADPTERPAKHAALLNYAFCYGDGVYEVGYEPGLYLEFRDHAADALSQRGAFASGVSFSFDDLSDGTANTILLGEVVTYDGSRRAVGAVASNVAGLRDDPGLCLQAVASESPALHYRQDVALRMTPDGLASRGGNWADGAITWSGFNTILPPNSPSCDTEREHRLEGVFSASSNHAGGCQVVMADGSVRFITADIDTGDLHQASVYRGSPIADTVDSPYGVWGAMGTRGGGPVVE